MAKIVYYSYTDISTGRKSALCRAQQEFASKEAIVLDSGASQDTFSNYHWLSKTKKIRKEEIVMGDNSKVDYDTLGETGLLVNGKSRTRTRLRLNKVLYVPSLGATLLSCAAMTEHGFTLISSADECFFMDKGEKLGKAITTNGLYHVEVELILHTKVME